MIDRNNRNRRRRNRCDVSRNPIGVANMDTYRCFLGKFANKLNTYGKKGTQYSDRMSENAFIDKNSNNSHKDFDQTGLDSASISKVMRPPYQK